MLTLSQLQAKQAAEIAALTRSHEIAALCPVPPKSVQLTSGGLATWISYECASLADALALVERLGDVLPFWQYKGTFSRFQPESLANEKSGEQVSGPYAFSLDISQGEGFGPSAKLKAYYTLSSGEIVQAHINLRPAGYGPEAWHNFGASAVDAVEYRGRHRHVVRTFQANTSLSAMSDKLVKWGTGDSKSAHFEYFWTADYEDGGSDHATRQLWSIAEESRRNAFKASPMAESFLGVLLEDAQMSDNDRAVEEEREDRDAGTIWTCPESTFQYALKACRNFASRFPYSDDEMQAMLATDAERIGSDLYLTMAGHGAGFPDREWDTDADTSQAIAAKLDKAASECGRLESYIGDDSRVYICGAE